MNAFGFGLLKSRYEYIVDVFLVEKCLPFYTDCGCFLVKQMS